MCWTEPMGKRARKPRGSSVAEHVAHNHDVAGSSPAPATIPPQLEHERIDIELRQLGRRQGENFLQIAEAVHRAIHVRAHEHYGFADPLKYAEARTRMSYRSLKRGQACWEAVLRVPEQERAALTAAFAELGGHKASVIAPAVGQEHQDWKTWVDLAQDATEDALQSLVSEELGTGRQGGNKDEPGAAMYRYLLTRCPPEGEELLRGAFEAGFKILQNRNAWAALLAMCEEVTPEWLNRVEHGVE